jgi:hypothetical protein
MQVLSLTFVGIVLVAAASSAAAHAPAPAPKPIVVKECHDVCKDNCYQDVQKKCFDVPYHEDVSVTLTPHCHYPGNDLQAQV